MRKGRKTCFAALIAMLIFAFSSQCLAADKTPSGEVSVETTAVAVGIGFQWGKGTLTFEGKTYDFKVKGLSIVDVGASSISAKGVVYHLNKVSDFAGTFAAAGAGAALGGGAGAITMENQYGVVMQLTSTKAGIQLKLAPEGIKIQLEE